MSERMSYYPAFLDMKNKPCVVIGGGAVALRKVQMLLDHEAKVTVISPQICSDLEAMDRDSITIKRREYRAGDIDAVFVVVAATDDEAINRQVAQEAAEKGILINVVDVPALSSFIVPSYLKRGDLTIAVSTSGKSPALARKIRTELEQIFNREYEELITVIENVRAELKDKGMTVPPEKWQQALDIERYLGLIRSGNQEQVRRTLLEKLTEAEN